MSKKKNEVSETTETTSMSVMIPTTTKDVPAAIEMLKNQLKELKKNCPETVNITVKYDNNIDINTCDSISKLMEVSASIRARAGAYTKEIILQGLEDMNIANFSHNGHSAEEWLNAIRKSSFELLNKTKINQIETAIDELSKHLDADTKLAITLANIMKTATKPVV